MKPKRKVYKYCKQKIQTKIQSHQYKFPKSTPNSGAVLTRFLRHVIAAILKINNQL